MSNISKRRRDGSRAKFKSMGDHTEFLNRITKTLYYGQLPSLACLSLPVTEISCELWSEAQRGRSLRRLHADAAARLARAACVSPCALVLAILYLERLQACNPDYLANTSPSDLFLVSLMVSNKFLQDDGEDDEVVASEWAASGGVDLPHLKRLEIDFLNAIDWNVFVSERAFSAGLSRLERAVALRQARARGFFTYCDLAAAADSRLLGQAAAALAAALTAALAALAGLVALLGGALLAAQTCLPALQLAGSREALLALLAPLSPLAPASSPAALTAFLPLTSFDIPLPTERLQYSNATLDDGEEVLEEPAQLTCCTRWLRHAEAAAEPPARRWYDSMAVQLQAGPGGGGGGGRQPGALAPLRAWLYHSSLVEPAQRWLEKVALFLKSNLEPPRPAAGCARPRVNFSQLAALLGAGAGAATDR